MKNIGKARNASFASKTLVQRNPESEHFPIIIAPIHRVREGDEPPVPVPLSYSVRDAPDSFLIP